MSRLALVACLLTGCSAQAHTQVIVEIFAEPGVVDDAESLRVTIMGGARGDALTLQADQILGNAAEEISWPVTAALVPAGEDPERVFLIEAEATDSFGSTLGIVRARSSYVAGQTLVLRLTLEECCRMVASSCGPSETCRSCACATAEVPVETLPDYRSDASTHPDGGDPTDASVETDAGGDSGNDAGRDAGNDAGRDAGAGDTSTPDTGTGPFPPCDGGAEGDPCDVDPCSPGAGSCSAGRCVGTSRCSGGCVCDGAMPLGSCYDPTPPVMACPPT